MPTVLLLWLSLLGQFPTPTVDADRRAMNAYRVADAQSAGVKQPGDAVKIWSGYLAAWPSGAWPDKARAQLMLWQQRVEGRAVLIGRRWWLEAELIEGAKQAEPVMQAVFAGLAKLPDVKTAGELTKQLDELLARFPAHRDAWYVRGGVNFKMERFPAAAADFLKATEADAQFWPAWANRAACLQRMKNASGAVLACQAALSCVQAGSEHEDLLDNFQEALALLEPNYAKHSTMIAARKAFETRMEARITRGAANGQFRWGTQWLTREEYQKLQDQLAKLEAQLSPLRSRCQGADQALQASQTQLLQVQQELATIDGAMATGALDPQLLVTRRATLRDQQSRLIADVNYQRDSLSQAEQELAAVQATAPTPPMRGQVVPVGPQGLAMAGPMIKAPMAPLATLDTAPPASQPAAAPATPATQPAPATMPWMVDSPLPPR